MAGQGQCVVALFSTSLMAVMLGVPESLSPVNARLGGSCGARAHGSPMSAHLGGSCGARAVAQGSFTAKAGERLTTVFTGQSRVF